MELVRIILKYYFTYSYYYFYAKRRRMLIYVESPKYLVVGLATNY